MKPRFPLSAKILLWFFLNLLVLVAVFYLVLRVQFRFGLDLLISGRGGDRIQGLANVIAAELADQPRGEWDATLRRFGEGYGVHLLLLRPDGGVVAGEALELPRVVRERLRERPLVPQRLINPELPPRREREGTFPRTPLDPSRVNEEGNLPRREREEMQPDSPRPVGGDAPNLQTRQPRPPNPEADLIRNPPLPPSPPQPRPRFMLRAGSPSRYWVGVPLPLPEAQRAPPGLTLLAVSSSLRGGGLFFDHTPWLITAGAVVVLSVLFWLPLVRGITRSLTQLTCATGEIAEGRFNTRVADDRSDELGSLATAVNRMAERLAGFVSGQKRFLGDTAHELCAPIARMQMALGILEQRADEKQKPYVNDVREELQHISGLVNELLSFSKAGLREQPVALQPVNVADIARRVVEREGRNGGNITVAVEASLTVQAEPELLTRALANLVRNALRYAGDAGPVAISARGEGRDVRISVTDEGPGVPPDALHKIFDPFYRIEASRSRETGGVGLGLAIVKTCIEACGGTVAARNRELRGLEVCVVLRST